MLNARSRNYNAISGPTEKDYAGIAGRVHSTLAVAQTRGFWTPRFCPLVTKERALVNSPQVPYDKKIWRQRPCLQLRVHLWLSGDQCECSPESWLLNSGQVWSGALKRAPVIGNTEDLVNDKHQFLFPAVSLKRSRDTSFRG